MRVAVVGASAISAFGNGWRGLGEAIVEARTLPGVPAEPAPDRSPLARARKMMSRGAYLAASCLGELVRGLAGRPAACGYFLGVGASGGSLDDVIALLRESFADGVFSLERFGDRGLAACNPLLAFQLMNNFTLCHGAILEAIGGPNGALFSRGAGTTAALIEAVQAIVDDDCACAIAGGADSAIHPVTRAELARDRFVARGLVPAEGAGLVALELETTDASPIGFVDGCAIASGHGRALCDATSEATERATLDVAGVDLIVTAAWGPPAAVELERWATAHVPAARVVDATARLGDALAASPALAWIAALDLLVAGRAERALVLNAGTDGDVGAVALSRGAP